MRHPRVLLKVPTVDRLRTYYLKDLSEGGAFIRLGAPLPLGSMCTVQLEAPGLDEPLTLLSQVVRVVAPGESDRPGMAVKFVDTDAEKNQRLQGLIREHLSEEPPADAPSPSRPPPPPVKPVGQSPAAASLSSLSFAASPVAAPAVPAASSEVVELRAQLELKDLEATDLRLQLAEAQGKAAALEEQLRLVEQEGEDRQELTSQVAVELEQAREELTRARAEAQAARAIAEAARAEASAAAEALASSEQARKGLSSDVAMAQGKLAAQKKAYAVLSSELEAERARAAQVRVAPAPPDAASAQPPPRAAAPVGAASLRAEDLFQDVDLPVEPRGYAVPLPSSSQVEPRVPWSTPASAEPAIDVELDLDAPAEDADEELELEELPEVEEEDEPAAAWEVAFEDDAPSAATLEGFAQSLEQGALLRTSSAYDSAAVVDPGERMVGSMLQEELCLNELLERASAHPIKDQFVRILFGLNQRGLIALRAAP